MALGPAACLGLALVLALALVPSVRPGFAAAEETGSGDAAPSQAATAYPLFDGRCAEYAALGAESRPLNQGVHFWWFQDESFVWLCWELPAGSFGVLDLEIDAPGLADPLNLHVSMQLGEWRLGHPDEAPSEATSELWGRIDGWYGNVVRERFVRQEDGSVGKVLAPSEARELQLSKERFGRGVWKLRMRLASLAAATEGGATSVVFPPVGEVGKELPMWSLEVR